ncbi:hypothetical protein GTZ99_01270 [Novosphingobium sp. FSY-8]|uniref:Uncharacterized protein n=1 Tax=Novosphingobium ovatum TaxID=1908523 RepID=A0ABW9X9H4_9SPHN|nr:hypothetical protein [Novosphingobium ovatum]NBC35185.1 hypothetical protein [Novosphingobium ovatum]
MVAPNMIPAIKATLRANEIGNGSPYELRFARLGKSGASFGYMQGDTNVSQLARDTLKKILIANGSSDGAAGAIITALARPLPNGNPLSAGDTATVSAALKSAKGKSIVDAMDAQFFDIVIKGLDTLISAAKTARMGVEPLAMLYAAAWINMTGAPVTMCKWVGGMTANGVPAPMPPMLGFHDIVSYLQATPFYTQNPANFDHLAGAVRVGMPLLP